MYFPVESNMKYLPLLSLISTVAYGFVSINTPRVTVNRFKQKYRSRKYVSTITDDGVGIISERPIPPDMDSYVLGYKSVFEEIPCAVCKPIVDENVGVIPPDLVGTYFRSGPAMFSAGSLLPPKKSIVQPKQPPARDGKDVERMVKHPFEGDGGILGVTFSGDGTATVRYRFVRTNAFTNERKRGAKLYSGMDSTRNEGPSIANGQGNDFPLPMFRHHLMPGLNKKRKNTSNTRAVYWSKKLITLWEGGLPYKLDSLALSSEGRSQLGGILIESSPFGGKAVYDPKRERMLFYSNKQDSDTSELNLFEFNSKFRLVHKAVHQLPGFAVLNDFAATENYAIFIQPPISTNKMQFLVSKDPVKSLTMQQQSYSILHLIKRGTEGSVTKSISIPMDGISDADLQLCNAYEEDSGNVIVFDAIRSDGRNLSQTAKVWPWTPTLKDFQDVTAKKSLWRYTVKVNDGSVMKECLSDVQTSFCVVNPLFSCQKHRFIYSTIGALSNEVAPPQGIGRFDTVTKEFVIWMGKEDEFVGEPMFAHRKTSDNKEAAEDDGYIISVLLNGSKKESEVIIFDASRINDGPITRVPLGMIVPHGLFGCFTYSDEANWSADEIDRRAKLADKMESRGNMWNEVKSDFSGLGLRLDDWEEYFGDWELF